jgi:hypothetical protein
VVGDLGQLQRRRVEGQRSRSGGEGVVGHLLHVGHVDARDHPGAKAILGARGGDAIIGVIGGAPGGRVDVDDVGDARGAVEVEPAQVSRRREAADGGVHAELVVLANGQDQPAPVGDVGIAQGELEVATGVAQRDLLQLDAVEVPVAQQPADALVVGGGHRRVHVERGVQPRHGGEVEPGEVDLEAVEPVGEAAAGRVVRGRLRRRDRAVVHVVGDGGELGEVQPQRRVEQVQGQRARGGRHQHRQEKRANEEAAATHGAAGWASSFTSSSSSAFSEPGS